MAIKVKFLHLKQIIAELAQEVGAPSYQQIDEDQIKDSLLAVGANPTLISKNLAELKSIKVSSKYPDQLVLGADSVISLNNELINKPNSREEGLSILKKLNGSTHYLITSVSILDLHQHSSYTTASLKQRV